MSYDASCISKMVIVVRTKERDNLLLVADEPVEFEEQPVQIQDCRKNTDPFRGICRIFLNLIKNWKVTTFNQLVLETSPPIMPKKTPDIGLHRLG